MEKSGFRDTDDIIGRPHPSRYDNANGPPNDGSTHPLGPNLEGTAAQANGRPPLYVGPCPGTKRRDTRPTSPGCARPQSVGKSMQRDLVKGNATEGHHSTPHRPIQSSRNEIDSIQNVLPLHAQVLPPGADRLNSFKGAWTMMSVRHIIDYTLNAKSR